MIRVLGKDREMPIKEHKVVPKPKRIMLLHPEKHDIPILTEDRKMVMKTLPSSFVIDKIIEKEGVFSKICFHNGTQGWVLTRYIREV